ncbi:momilactone A synthase-like [Musa troglodytarum]|uniref:Momilactone A synthase-like n=1 Tax=Musa troglodytarum TaxID=320322 RepID=A0A9E7II16_9LILI|nr:momilactone A synthase-like [Musa troglodytarum]
MGAWRRWWAGWRRTRTSRRRAPRPSSASTASESTASPPSAMPPPWPASSSAWRGNKSSSSSAGWPTSRGRCCGRRT